MALLYSAAISLAAPQSPVDKQYMQDIGLDRFVYGWVVHVM